jgi:hypothetical protein
MKKTIILFLIMVQYVFSNCIVDDDIMLSILIKEREHKRSIGYEFLISFNNEDDAKLIRKDTSLKKMFLNNRTMDCKNRSNCAEVLKKILQKNIRNLDVGAYQANTVYHLNSFNNYEDIFNLDKSYNFACNYVMSKINKLGYSWESIAAYHSETPEFNTKYKNELIDIYTMVVALKSRKI